MTFALLQSRARVAWSCLLSSRIKTDLNYSANNCFPEADPRAVIPTLEAIGEPLYQARAKYMLETDQGLTKTYNALKDPAEHDPRIVELRQLHEEMDRSVLVAYGWQDIEAPPFCPKTEEDRAAFTAFEDESSTASTSSTPPAREKRPAWASGKTSQGPCGQEAQTEGEAVEPGKARLRNAIPTHTD